MKAKADRFPYFDSLRAMAAISVLLYHSVGFFGGGFRPGAAIRPYLARLDGSLVVFLLISAFLLYRPFVSSHARSKPRPSARAYGWRRFLRITPAYWVALLVTVLVLTIPGIWTVHGIVTYFGIIQIYKSSTIGTTIPPAWTIGLEISFYVFLPIWALFLRRLTRKRDRQGRLKVELIGAIGLVVASVAYKVVLFATGVVHNPPTRPFPILVTLPGYLDALALGMILAIVSVWLAERAELPSWLRWVDRYPGLSWLIALAAMVIGAKVLNVDGYPNHHFTPAQFMERQAVNCTLALFLLLPAVFGDQTRGLVRKFLSWRPLLYVGMVSYGIYLFHWVILVKLHAWNIESTGIHPYLLWSVVPIVLSIAVGSLSYFLVERPAMSLRNRWLGRRDPRAPRPEPAVEPAP